jgi:hypothetical protein
MNLEPQPAQPGVWINPAWRNSEPGLFALIIGVSRYRHLQGGPDPAPETYDLGQLQVSALTAFRVFRWVGTSYSLDGCPVARCWVLLAPTREEKDFEHEITKNPSEPTFAACEQAVGEWYRSLKQLPPTAAAESRALFFFSGHGLEIHQEKQILLPSDYLAPPAENWDRALSTANLRAGLASLAVPRQFFFLDACRNDHQKLRSKNVQGTKVLREDESALVNSALVAPLLYATASGHQAWQQQEPRRGLSLFGTAFLEGLSGAPDIELRRQGAKYTVCLYPLQGYVKRRVIAQLRSAQAQVVQPVKLGGIVDDECLTCLASPSSVENGLESTGLPDTGPPRPPVPADVTNQLLEAAFTVKQAVPAHEPRSVWAKDYGIGHRLFGSEAVTWWWSQGLRLFGLGARRDLNPDSLVLHNVDHSEGADVRSFRVELSINEADDVGYWLELRDPAGDRYACLLPVDWAESRRPPQPHYLVEFDVQQFPNRPSGLTRLEASVSRQSPHELLASAVLMWQTYRNGNLGESLQRYQGKMLEQMVWLRRESSLAATIAGAILLRTRRLDLLHDWLRNLANWFPAGSDAPVLWAEQVLRTEPADGKEAAEREAVESLLRLRDRGLPLTAEGMSYAASMLERLARPTTPQGAQLDELRKRVQVVLRYFRPADLFCCYSGFDAGTDPAVLLGLPPRSGPERPAPPPDPRPGEAPPPPPGTIEEHEDYVLINGVRVPKRGAIG